MNIIIVIPARYESTRLPGKPLTMISGHHMIERVWRLGIAIKGIAGVYVATDDQRIADAVSAFGGQAILTSPDCRNGTERVLSAIDAMKLTPDGVVNLQGDAPITPPWVIQAMVDAMSTSSADIITPAIRLTGHSLSQFLEEKKTTPSSGTTVVTNKYGNALYFSKAVLPYTRTAHTEVLRHIGLYAYRMDALRRLLSLPEGRLEKTERLEQLRALENGLTIKIEIVDYRGRSHASVDAPEDVARVEAIIRREGELLVN